MSFSDSRITCLSATIRPVAPSGQEPGASVHGPWQEAAAADGTGTSPWAATRVYVAGERVTFEGANYVARWWTRDRRPDGSAWGPWERVA